MKVRSGEILVGVAGGKGEVPGGWVYGSAAGMWGCVLVII